MRLQLDRYESPVGNLFLVTDEQAALRALEFVDRETRMHRLLHDHYGEYELVDRRAPKPITKTLDAYFKGDIKAVNKLHVETGGTPFQRQVWQALRTIPAGKTKSYGMIASQVGRPAASRAVGAANGSNPVAIVVPCHRVIGSNGSLTGYAGGLPRKRWLLDHESGISSLQLMDYAVDERGKSLPVTQLEETLDRTPSKSFVLDCRDHIVAMVAGLRDRVRKLQTAASKIDMESFQ